MATPIPALSSCKARMTSEEERLAERLEGKLDNDPHCVTKPFTIADHLGQAHQEGHAWVDMAILCTDWKTMDLRAKALAQRKLPFNVRKRSGDFNPGANAIQVMTMKVSKGLEFPVVALPGVGHMPAEGEDDKEAARVFYVTATRATQKLIVTTYGQGAFGRRLGS